MDEDTCLKESLSLIFDKMIEITPHGDQFLAFEPLTNISDIGETKEIVRENLKRAILEKRNYCLNGKLNVNDLFVSGDSVDE